MSYVLNEVRFLSSDGKNTIYAEIYAPKDGAVRGVVQLAHGMIDYTARYVQALRPYVNQYSQCHLLLEFLPYG